MNATESRTLRIGDRVTWRDVLGGVVIDTNPGEFTVKWDDGQTGSTYHHEAYFIRREKASA